MDRFELRAVDGHRIHGCCWLPAAAQPVRAVLLIAHGMSEYAARYQPFAEQLAAQGIAVYAHDHRGHGPYAAHHGWFAATQGWDKVLADVESVRQHAVAQHHGLPVLLFGHSMGSFVARSYFLQHGSKLSGLMLSATGYRQRPLARLLRAIARLCGRLGGMDRPSRLMAWLVFGSFNLGFIPTRTKADWLSRDTAQVDAYLADPLCGFDPTPGLWIDLFGGIIAMEQEEATAKGSLPRHCPVYMLTGSRDPVSRGKLALGQLEIRYRDAGLIDIHSHVYKGGRHEMLNESNRAEVLRDISSWLQRVCAIKAQDL